MTMNIKSGISVILPVFNNASTVRDTVLSVLDQDYHLFELIIVDDGSTDSSDEILSEFVNYKNVRIYFREENRGAASCMNLGTEKARYDRIAIIDGDAVASRNWLSKASEKFEDNDIIFGPFVCHPRNFFERTLASTISFPQNSCNYMEDCVKRFPPVGTNFFYKKAIFYRLGGFDTTLRIGYDRAFIYKAIEEGSKIKYISDLIVFHPLPDTLSKFLKRSYRFTCWDLIARKKFKQKKLKDYGFIFHLKRTVTILFIIGFLFIWGGIKIGGLLSISFLILAFLCLLLKYLRISKDLRSAVLITILGILSSFIKLFVFVFRPHPLTQWKK